MSYKDLVQEGWCGLIEATKKYKKDKKVSFSTYAYYWVKKYILETIETEIDTSKAENGYENEYFDNSVAKRATIEKEFEELTEQEQDILALYAEGYTVRGIATKEKIKVEKTRVHEIISNIETKPDKPPLKSYNKLRRENKTKSETSDKEKYAFSDYLDSDKTREEAEHDYHKGKPKPTYNTEYDPNKSKIDFVGVGWKEFLESKGIDMSKIHQNHYQALLWQSGYDRKDLNRPKEKDKWESPVLKRVRVKNEETQETDIYRLMKDSKDSNRNENKISPDTSLGKTLAGCNRLEKISIDNNGYKVIAMKGDL